MVTVPSSKAASETPKIPPSRKAGAIFESFCPVVVGTVAGTALAIWNPPTDKTAFAVEKLLTGSIDAAAVLAGFQVTALTLLLSIADKPIVTRLKKTGHYTRLISFHWHAIIALLFWLLWSMFLLAAQGGTLDCNGRCSDLQQFTRWSAVILVGGMVWATCASFRVMHLLVKLLRASAGSETS